MHWLQGWDRYISCSDGCTSYRDGGTTGTLVVAMDALAAVTGTLVVTMDAVACCDV